MIVLNNMGVMHRLYNYQIRAQGCFDELLVMWLLTPVQIHPLEGTIFTSMGLCNTSIFPAAAA